MASRHVLQHCKDCARRDVLEMILTWKRICGSISFGDRLIGGGHAGGGGDANDDDVGEDLAGSEGGWEEKKERGRDDLGTGVSFLLIGSGFLTHYHHSLHRYLIVISNPQAPILSRSTLFVALVLFRFHVE